MKKKHVLAMALLLTAISISTQARAADRVVVNAGETSVLSAESFSNLTTTGDGAAISVQGNLTVSNSGFTGNSVTGTNSSGGSIFVNAMNKVVTVNNSTFTGNSTTGSNSDGSAVSVMNGTVNINDSTFKENTANWGTVYQYASRGGERVSTINIDGSLFENNTAKSVGGVGIFNVGNITNTSFIGNKATSATDDGAGAVFVGAEGALATLDNVIFDSNTSASSGGAIGTRVAVNANGTKNNNSGAVLNVTNSTFKNNTAATTGGAIDNHLYAGTSVSNSTFEKNSAKDGGALYNHGEADTTGALPTITLDTVTMTENSATGSGGAIYTESDLTVSGSTFTGNSVTGESSSGGAIFVDAIDCEVNINNSTFTGNSTTGSNSDGSAVSVMNGTVNINSSTFKENTANWGTVYQYASRGGARVSTINIDGSTFENNTANSVGGVGIFNVGNITNTSFIGNKATSATDDGAGAVFVGAEGALATLDNVIFDSNTSASSGGAIGTRVAVNANGTKNNNSGAVLNVTNSTFKNNTAATTGGAIDNHLYAGTSVSNSTFEKNSAKDGGALYNHGEADTTGALPTITLDTVTMTENSATGNGGAIYNESEVTIIDSTFTGNSASGNGGAIYATGDVNINAQNSNVEFSGNSAADGGDIYMSEKQDGTVGDLKMNIASDKSVSLDGGVSGASEFDMNVAGGGTLDVQSAIKKAAMTVEGSTLHLNTGSDISGVKSIMLKNGSTLDTRNNQVDDFASAAGLVDTDGSSTTVSADVNMSTGVGDNIGQLLKESDNNSATAGTTHTIVIDQINAVASGATSDNVSIDLMSALGLADNESVGQVGLNTQNTVINDVMTPIRRLSGSIDNDGMLNYAPTGNSYNDFNSAVMVAPIAAQVGGYLNQLQSYDEAFMNMDMYMLMTKEQRLAKKYANKYAVNEASLGYQEPYAAYAQKSGFFRPYGSFESVRLDNGPKVSNVAWGTYAGLESELYELGNDWDAMFSIYAGYNGSHQAYQGNSIYQNGGTLGATGVAYKGNFFTGLTANIGSNVADADTKYGSEDFAMLMTGVASKTGYNFEMAEGKFIVQPSLLMAYTMVNTFDYTNAAGVNINTDALHAFTFEPGVKFIGNLKNGWQPYAGVSVVMNAMDDANFKANDTALPKLTVKPYAKYGVGVKKSWGERFTGFLQAFVTSGGRDGIGFQGGFKWQLGKKVEKVQGPSEKKYIKAGSKSRTIS